MLYLASWDPLMKLLCVLEMQTVGQASLNVFAVLENDNQKMV